MAAKTCKDRFLTEDDVILAVNSSYGGMTRLAQDVACMLNSGCILGWWHLKKRQPEREWTLQRRCLCIRS